MTPKRRSMLIFSLRWCAAWFLITYAILLTHPTVQCNLLIISTTKLHRTPKQTKFHKSLSRLACQISIPALKLKLWKKPPQNIPRKQHQPGSVDQNLGRNPLYVQPLLARNQRLYWGPCTYLNHSSSSKQDTHLSNRDTRTRGTLIANLAAIIRQLQPICQLQPNSKINRRQAILWQQDKETIWCTIDSSILNCSTQIAAAEEATPGTSQGSSISLAWWIKILAEVLFMVSLTLQEINGSIEDCACLMTILL